MATLYLRNVPDAVAEQLAELARREGISVSALAVRELTEAARRADNRALLAALPSVAIDPEVVVDAVRVGRDER